MSPTIAAVVLSTFCMLSSVAACDRQPLDFTPVVRPGGESPDGGDTAGPTQPEGGLDGATPKAIAADGSAGEEVAGQVPTKPEPANPVSCDSLVSGGNADGLRDFFWQRQVAEGSSSRAWDFVWIEQGCTLRYQHEDIQSSVTMGARDCADARGWVTNARFLAVLRTSVGCAIDGGKDATEAFDLTLAEEGRIGRKTYLCPEPTVETVRGCLRSIVDRLFVTEPQLDTEASTAIVR
jgi:hypothetical protein